MITFDKLGFKVNGEDDYLVSGEFHYFRVPKADWRRRMQLFKEAGGNCLATYVPWVVHEPEEGTFLFDDCDYRDLSAFLETAKEEGMPVIFRPGPYIYSEMIAGGLPLWLVEGYPEAHAMRVDGTPIGADSMSYLHPLFLEKARRYYRAVNAAVKPYLASNGGPVVMYQLDNELAGVQVWAGSMDYNPETLGLGDDEGRYARFLRGIYGSVEALNEAYGTSFGRFGEVSPVDPSLTDKKKAGDCRRMRDYTHFYWDMNREYLWTLRGWMREDGIDSPLCHNSGNAHMNVLFEKIVEFFAEQGDPLLLCSDHYYNLSQTWQENNPSPKYALRTLISIDCLRAMGLPPAALEMPGGSCMDTPPILGPDMLASYLTNTALGIKGVNYYIFTGGPNVPGTTKIGPSYDFNAAVSADGEVRAEKYEAMQTFGRFMHAHKWMQRTERFASVQIGFELDLYRTWQYDWTALPMSGEAADDLATKGLLYTLFESCYAPELKLLTGELDLAKPLVVPCPSSLSEEAQQAVVRFAEAGGQVLLLPYLPETDMDFKPCRILADLFADCSFQPASRNSWSVIKCGGKTMAYGMTVTQLCTKMGEGVKAYAVDNEGRTVGVERAVGQGRVIFLGAKWIMELFSQCEMMEEILADMGAEPAVIHDNRQIFTALWKRDEEHGTFYLMNLYSSPQKTRAIVGGRDFGEFILGAMEVRPVDY